MKKKKIQTISNIITIADGLKTSELGSKTFPIIKKNVDDIILVTDDEIRQTLHFVLERMKQVIEPSGVAALSAVMSQKLNIKNKNIACIASGGNIDINNINELL